MATVETVRGPVELDDLGRDAHARARIHHAAQSPTELGS